MHRGAPLQKKFNVHTIRFGNSRFAAGLNDKDRVDESDWYSPTILAVSRSERGGGTVIVSDAASEGVIYPNVPPMPRP